MEEEYRNAVRELEAAQARVGALAKEDPARADAKRAFEVAAAAVRAAKEALKIANAKKTYAAIGSPLHEAVVARFPAAVVAELESDALARLAEREARSAARKAAKAAAVPPSAPELPKGSARSERRIGGAAPAPVEVIVRRPGASRSLP